MAHTSRTTLYSIFVSTAKASLLSFYVLFFPTLHFPRNRTRSLDLLRARLRTSCSKLGSPGCRFDGHEATSPARSDHVEPTGRVIGLDQ
eukprot:SAG31_NODE_2762_length_5129_cov_3.337972_3_plen_89_part_00